MKCPHCGKEISAMPDSRIIVVDVGHSQKDGGAVSWNGVSEWTFNSNIAFLMSNKDPRIKVHYRTTVGAIAKEINALKPALVLSLHANAANKRATGSEIIWDGKRQASKRLAEIVLKHVVKSLGLKSRGVKPPYNGRGAGQLSGITAPNVICEPFFIDNKSDYELARAKQEELADAYLAAINEALCA